MIRFENSLLIYFRAVLATPALFAVIAYSDVSLRAETAKFYAAENFPRFTDVNVPSFGPHEIAIDPPTWKVSEKMTALELPGKGAAEHPMLYIGEGCNKIFIVRNGEIIWTYSTGQGWELDDAWMLSNGNILYSRMSYAEEVTPDKKVVWHRDASPATELHTLQPIGRAKILFVENGLPPHLYVVDKVTGEVLVNHVLPAISTTNAKSIHAQFRRVRYTAAGTYLIAYLEMDRVVEYDQNFNEIWSYNIRSPWAAIRLHNGNTLITDEQDALTREVSPEGKTVWEIKLSDLPAKYNFHGSQSCVRLDNGNTVLCSRGDGGAGCQLIEVTKDKKVVSAMYDFARFGPATSVQILDQPGIPEEPGALEQ